MKKDPLRLLIIEDDARCVKTLETKIQAVAERRKIAVHISVMKGETCDEFRGELERWYGGRQEPLRHMVYDATSLDVIFQEHDGVNESNGGERLHAWLDQKGYLRHLGKIVLRSNADPKYFENVDVLVVRKGTSHEEGAWEDLLVELWSKRPGD